MSSTGWSLLDEKDETALHKSRLLNVEEKPFKRLTKRLRGMNALVASAVRQQATPPPEPVNGGTTDADGDVARSPTATTSPEDEESSSLSGLRADIAIDFAAFDSSVARLQFLLTANARERDRYAADRGRIQDTSQRVRDNTTVLRRKLDDARATLEQRKKFDELAEKITNNKSLRPRAEQTAALQKLEDECAQLEAESEEYTRTWRERRSQFEKIMEESMRLRRQIRDEKEEVERREGMDDGDAEPHDGTGTPRPSGGLVSGNATPRPDSGLVAAKVLGGLESAGDGAAGTPRAASSVGHGTPWREGSMVPETQTGGLKVLPGDARSFSRGGSQEVATAGEGKGSDVEMDNVKDGQQQGSPDSPLTPVPDDGKDDVPAIVLEGKEGDKMDTT
ncbi:Tho complex subunit 7-domain-containing protein [Coniochaeta sp. 2T2.1]|nr:Tho complex subunit 7-domain-containing protein [Coniochaeta sp. 2T2.1]